MTTTDTLDKAFRLLRELPQDMQEELGAQLVSSITEWRALKADIARGAEELARGEGIEVPDANSFIDEIESKHGRP